jgi:hypothetical protein
MQSRQPTPYFRRVARARRVRDFALDVGLFSYFCLCCVFIGACVVGFYRLMQPIVYPNLRDSAYGSTDLPAPERPAETSSVAERASRGEDAFAAAIKPEEKPGGGAAENSGKAKKSEAATLSSDTKRKRPAQPKRHDPRMDYAAQPGFGDYRPWGSYQNWIGDRPSRNYQSWGGYRPWNSYQGGGYRNGR